MLAGDNAIVVGLAAAGLPAKDRARVIAIGIAAATLMRIGFAAVTVQLLQIVGLLLAGGLVLLWVAWKLWREIRARRESHRAADAPEPGAHDTAALGHAPPKRMRDAIVQIVVADVSMSLDNVLAVAGIARDHTWVLVVGLALSVAFMGLAAAWIARQLEGRPWIAYVGLAVIFYVAMAMIVEGWREVAAVAGV